MTTQKQIAQRLGISQPLVAQALRGNSQVAEKTRLRVVATAEEMGYSIHSNAEARSLIARRHGNRVVTGTIAVLMGDSLDGLPLQDMPFFNEILQGIHGTASQHNLDVSIHVLRPGNLPRAVTSDGVDGVICVYSRTISNDLRERNVTIPIVRLAEYEEEGATIYPDNRRGTYEVTQHLLQLGHQKIAYLGGWLSLDSHSQELRFQGYCDALREANILPDPELTDGYLASPSFTEGRQRAHILLEKKNEFSALVCSNDAAALGAVEACHDKGLSVPHDISITGFDGTPVGYGGSSTLTTAFYDRRIMGERAVGMLQTMAAAPESQSHQEVLPIQLLIRNSTSIPASMPSF